MSKIKIARTAGVIYLIVVLTGIFNLVYIPSQLVVWENSETTIKNIVENMFLFRLGIVTGVISYIGFALLAFVLFLLFQSTNRNMSLLMLLLALVSVPISVFNMVNKVGVISLLGSAEYLNVFEPKLIQSQVMLLLKSYSNGISVVQVFWGIWLLPFGYLIIKSAYIPKLLGVLLILGCFGYLIGFFSDLLFINLDIPFIGLPGAIGEIVTCAWLLIRGVKVRKRVSEKFIN